MIDTFIKNSFLDMPAHLIDRHCIREYAMFLKYNMPDEYEALIEKGVVVEASKELVDAIATESKSYITIAQTALSVATMLAFREDLIEKIDDIKCSIDDSYDLECENISMDKQRLCD